MSDRDQPQPVEVWMDGECAVCVGARRWMENRPSATPIRFQDFREAADVELPVDRRRLERAMWARDTRGELHEGFQACRLLMATQPRWRWLSRMTARPPLSWLGAATYRVVARFRHLAR